MNATLPLSIGILCWRNTASLARALQSYAVGGLFDAARQTRLFLPEPTRDGILLGRRYGLDVRTAPNNPSLLENFARLAEGLDSEWILLLEDDCPLIEDAETTKTNLRIGLDLLMSGQAQAVRLRHRTFPGAARRFQTLDKSRRYHPPPGSSSGRRSLAMTRRVLRPGKARRMLVGLPYEDADPQADPHLLAAGSGPPRRIPNRPSDEWLAKQYPDVFRIIDGILLGSTEIVPWSNQSVLVGKSFYLEEVIARARSREAAHQTRAANIEAQLNRKAWRRSGWWIGLPEGLFAHELCT